MTHDMRAYPRELNERVALPGGDVVRVRALRRCDEDPVRELFSRLSARTRYLRFFSPMPALPDAVVRQLACVDYQRSLALVADTDADGAAEVVALGSFSAIDDETAEVSLVVRDDWQQRGVGVAVASRVLRAAEARGFHRFVAQALLDNLEIRRLLRRVGHVVAATSRYGVSELTFVARQIA